MSFKDRLNQYRTATKDTGARADDAAAALPMSQWAEDRRDALEPVTIAENWAAHVHDTAAELRELLWAQENGGSVATPATIRATARDLLTALGMD